MPSFFEYVADGPAAGRSTVDFIIGLVMWWRLWTQLAVFSVGGWLAVVVGGGGAFFGFVVGLLTATIIGVFGPPDLGVSIGGEPP